MCVGRKQLGIPSLQRVTDSETVTTSQKEGGWSVFSPSAPSRIGLRSAALVRDAGRETQDAMLSAADHKRLVKMRELQHAQMRKKERAKVRGATSTEPTIPRTRAKLSAPAPAAALQRTRAAASSQRTPRPTEVAPVMMPSKRNMFIALTRARNQAGRSHDLATHNRLCTPEGASAFLRHRRMHPAAL